MDKATEDTIMIFIVVGTLVFDALKDLLSTLAKGVMKDRRQMLMERTNAELRSMLKGMSKVSRLNKEELIDMVIQHC